MVQLSDRNCSKAAFLLVIAAIALAGTCASQNTPPVTSGEQIPVPGHAVPADYGQLSEHNQEWVMTQPPQVQAEFLLGAAINHDQGATDMINKMVDDWHGKLHFTNKIDDLQLTALYSNDLRVRAAAIEINLAVYKLSKTDAAADHHRLHLIIERQRRTVTIRIGPDQAVRQQVDAVDDAGVSGAD